jgi:hypothetical protein
LIEDRPWPSEVDIWLHYRVLLHYILDCLNHLLVGFVVAMLSYDILEWIRCSRIIKQVIGRETRDLTDWDSAPQRKVQE